MALVKPWNTPHKTHLQVTRRHRLHRTIKEPPPVHRHHPLPSFPPRCTTTYIHIRCLQLDQQTTKVRHLPTQPAPQITTKRAGSTPPPTSTCQDHNASSTQTRSSARSSTAHWGTLERAPPKTTTTLSPRSNLGAPRNPAGPAAGSCTLRHLRR